MFGLEGTDDPPPKRLHATDQQLKSMMSLPSWKHSAQDVIRQLLADFGLQIEQVKDSQAIPGSYWGDSEAGLVGSKVWVRNDTPLHSLLHEACHAICMGPLRRQQLDTDAGGEQIEENAVCYLQICLADSLAGYSAQQCCQDMDAWGYSFRLGSARAWFLNDAEDAVAHLQQSALMPENQAAVIAALTAAQC